MTAPTLDIPQEVVDILNDEQRLLLFKKMYPSSKEQSVQSTPIETKQACTFDELPRTRGKDKSKRSYPKKRVKKNSPIYKLKNFPKYSTPRIYNPSTRCWKSKNKQACRQIYLPFESLIILINDYKNNVPISETFRKIDSRLKTENGIKSLTYIYRAGGFNDGIFEHARKYGYNPEDLISKEYNRYNSEVEL